MQMTIKEFNKKLNITKEIELHGENNVIYNNIVYTPKHNKETGIIELIEV